MPHYLYSDNVFKLRRSVPLNIALCGFAAGRHSTCTIIYVFIWGFTWKQTVQQKVNSTCHTMEAFLGNPGIGQIDFLVCPIGFDPYRSLILLTTGQLTLSLLVGYITEQHQISSVTWVLESDDHSIWKAFHAWPRISHWGQHSLAVNC